VRQPLARPEAPTAGPAGPLTEVGLPCRRSEWHGTVRHACLSSMDRRHQIPTRNRPRQSRAVLLSMPQLTVDRRGNGILPVDQVGKSDPILARNERSHAIATSSNSQLIPDGFPACRATATMTDGHFQPLCTIDVDGSLSSDSFRAGRMSATAELGLLSRASSVRTVMRNYTGDEGRSFEFDNQVLISSHRKLLWSKATVVNVAEKSEQDFDRSHRGREFVAVRRGGVWREWTAADRLAGRLKSRRESSRRARHVTLA
jgi:hypothetical protein